jgi:hypothetical protein
LERGHEGGDGPSGTGVHLVMVSFNFRSPIESLSLVLQCLLECSGILLRL